MGNQITIIKRIRVRGGEEIQAIARSDRGTKYISKSVVVLREELTDEEYKAAVTRAIEHVVS